MRRILLAAFLFPAMLMAQPAPAPTAAPTAIRPHAELKTGTAVETFRYEPQDARSKKVFSINVLPFLAATSELAKACFLGAPVTFAVISLGSSGVGEYTTMRWPSPSSDTADNRLIRARSPGESP